MKKSNALMLSYIIFLVCTVVASYFAQWNIIDQVALAATIAGCFFSFADFLGWSASFIEPMVKVQKEHQAAYKKYLIEIRDTSSKDKVELQESVKLLQPFINSHERVLELIDRTKDVAVTVESAERYAIDSLREAEERDVEIDKQEKRIQSKKYAELFFAASGFLAFFILIAYTKIAIALTPCSSVITVMTFVVIMLNYFLKDVFEDSAKQEVSDLKELVEKVMERTAQYKQDMAEINCIETTNKVISNIKKLKDQKEEQENG